VEEVDDTEWYAVRYVTAQLHAVRPPYSVLYVLYSEEWAGMAQTGRASPNCPTLLCTFVSWYRIDHTVSPLQDTSLLQAVRYIHT
jgi:hypothetical protein